MGDQAWVVSRYGGLPDVLRDAGPDAWGQMLLGLAHDLPHPSPLRYLLLSNNGHRWGALAIATGKLPSVAATSTPKISQLGAMIAELEALGAHGPAVDSGMRAHLLRTAGMGGARPKATVHDEQGNYWLVKPHVAGDIADIPRLEHMAQQWGAASGLHFATTVLHSMDEGFSAVRVRRFDRDGVRRFMCVSAASLLQTEYPATAMETDRWSYPRRLAMQLAVGRFDIARAVVLMDAHRFGFDSVAHAAIFLHELLKKIEASFETSAAMLDDGWARFMRDRLHGNLALLRQP